MIFVGGFKKKEDRDRVDSLNMQIFSTTRVPSDFYYR